MEIHINYPVLIEQRKAPTEQKEHFVTKCKRASKEADLKPTSFSSSKHARFAITIATTNWTRYLYFHLRHLRVPDHVKYPN